MQTRPNARRYSYTPVAMLHTISAHTLARLTSEHQLPTAWPNVRTKKQTIVCKAKGVKVQLVEQREISANKYQEMQREGRKSGENGQFVWVLFQCVNYTRAIWEQSVTSTTTSIQYATCWNTTSGAHTVQTWHTSHTVHVHWDRVHVGCSGHWRVAHNSKQHCSLLVLLLVEQFDNTSVMTCVQDSSKALRQLTPRHTKRSNSGSTTDGAVRKRLMGPARCWLYQQAALDDCLFAFQGITRLMHSCQDGMKKGAEYDSNHQHEAVDGHHTLLPMYSNCWFNGWITACTVDPFFVFNWCVSCIISCTIPWSSLTWLQHTSPHTPARERADRQAANTAVDVRCATCASVCHLSVCRAPAAVLSTLQRATLPTHQSNSISVKLDNRECMRVQWAVSSTAHYTSHITENDMILAITVTCSVASTGNRINRIWSWWVVEQRNERKERR